MQSLLFKKLVDSINLIVSKKIEYIKYFTRKHFYFIIISTYKNVFYTIP